MSIRSVACPRCGGTMTTSSFDACWCTPEGRELIEGRSLETRQSWNCTACGGGLMFASQLCRCGRAQPGESKRAKPMPWDLLDGAEANAVIRRRFLDPTLAAS